MEVGGAVQLVDRMVDVPFLVAAPGADGRHPEGAGAHGDRGPDRAEADDPQREAFDQDSVFRLPLVGALGVVDLGKAFPHREEPTDGELGDRRGGDTGRVRDHAVLGEPDRVEMLHAGPDGLDPAEARRELADPLRQVEREGGIGPGPDGAFIVTELDRRARHVVRERAEVGLGDDLDVGKLRAQRCEVLVGHVPRKGDHHGRHAVTSLSTPGVWMGASVALR